MFTIRFQNIPHILEDNAIDVRVSDIQQVFVQFFKNIINLH